MSGFRGPCRAAGGSPAVPPAPSAAPAPQLPPALRGRRVLNSVVTWCIDPGALICPSAFPSQVLVLLQWRRYDAGCALKEAERCGCCDGLARTGSLQSK